jgi:hypothetical protein
MTSGTNGKPKPNAEVPAENTPSIAAALKKCCSYCCGPLEPGADQTVRCFACDLTFAVIPMGDGSVALQKQERE